MDAERIPTEQDHFRAYTKVIRALKGDPLTIRTADLGADKNMLTPASSNPRAQAHNPAMGLRGIRVCLNDTSLFIPQLRAVLRASAKGPVRLLIPMLTSLNEINQCMQLIENVKQSLRDDNIEFDEKLPIGGMVEVPAAAIASDRFAQRLDFLSIGTNDLIQYTLAIDRVDDQVDYLYEPTHPAVLSLIKMTIEAGQKAGIPVSMCGEMAGDPRYVRLLLGLGLTDFSMPPNQILEVKKTLISSRRSALKRKVNSLLASAESEDQQLLLDKINTGLELVQ